MNQLKVATINTHEGQLIVDPAGLAPFAERNVDLVLMQEVLGLDNDQLKQPMANFGYSIAAFSADTGLAIAQRVDAAAIKAKVTDTVTVIDGPREALIGKAIPGLAQRFRPRGILSTEFILADDTKLHVVTTHPIVFARPFVRRRELRDIDNYLTVFGYGAKLLFGADMNHYPRPNKIDKQLAARHALQRVVLDRSTWPVQDSRHEWLAKIGAVFTGKPVSDFDGELDCLLYKGLANINSEVVDVASDHRAAIGNFDMDIDITDTAAHTTM